MRLSVLNPRVAPMPQPETGAAAELQFWTPEGLPEGVGACFTLRTGGTSPEPWRSFNLGDHVGDSTACVASSTPTPDWPNKPRQPACDAATTSPERLHHNTGKQSATMITQACPG